MKIINYVLVAAISSAILTSCGGKEEKKKESFSYEDTKTEAVEAPKEEKVAVIDDTEAQKLLAKNTCVACHTKDKKIIGPPFVEIAERNYTNERIVELIYKPEPSNWPDYAVPMAPLPNVPRGEALKIAAWINALK